MVHTPVDGITPYAEAALGVSLDLAEIEDFARYDLGVESRGAIREFVIRQILNRAKEIQIARRLGIPLSTPEDVDAIFTNAVQNAAQIGRRMRRSVVTAEPQTKLEPASLS